MRDTDPRVRATELRRQISAFGGGRVPLDQQIDGERIVVAGPRVFRIPGTWSFHEFLMFYGQSQLGEDWISGNTQSGQGLHPLVTHLIKGKSDAQLMGSRDDKFVGITMNGDLLAFLSFAYDLFTLADNAVVQQSLFDRLRKLDQYQGARYEMFVAASLIRAGFTIVFEDESDVSISHCEFTATSRQASRSFSVEAKSRHRKLSTDNGKATPSANMGNLIRKALSKNANHERIIFVDVNLPSDDQPVFQQGWHQEVMSTLNELEKKQKQNDPWPRAIVFFTNRKTSPWPSEAAGNSTLLLTAINHPFFTAEENREALERTYPEIGTLFRAANELGRPPSHFFAQWPNA